MCIRDRGETVYDDYHVYAIQWSQDSVAFYLDGQNYYTATPDQVPAGYWEFNNNFFLLLNLAIGGPGTFLGTPSASSPFPNQDMLVDYVRVYQATTVSTTTPVITPSGILNAASFLGDIAPGSLISLFGYNLADNTYQGSQVLDTNNHFLTSVAGVSVSVNSVNAPLTYVAPGQINFQVPWGCLLYTSLYQGTALAVTKDARKVWASAPAGAVAKAFGYRCGAARPKPCPDTKPAAEFPLPCLTPGAGQRPPHGQLETPLRLVHDGHGLCEYSWLHL